MVLFRHLLLFFLWGFCYINFIYGGDSCPGVCSCKWKGGKQTVECRNKGLITIPDGIDPETQVLDMSGNNLQILPRDTFVRTGLLNLQKIYLHRCRLGQIDAHSFNGLTNLVELDLGDNLLTSVPSQAFRDTPFLRDLTLNANPIQKLDSHAFEMVSGLVKLDISNCEIETIAPKAFDNLQLLELLKLNGNKLTDLRPKTVQTLSRLQGVELHENPWFCDCRLRSMKEWLHQNNIPHPVSPKCQEPPRLTNRPFNSLEIDDFACKPEILPSGRYVEAGRGDNATIVCRVGAIPSADIKWYRHGRQLLNNSASTSVMGITNSHQRIYIFEDGVFEKNSVLVLTNAMDEDSGEFFCVAENGASLIVEANFTLNVSLRAAGVAALGSGQIAGLSAVFVLLFIILLVLLVLFLARIRRLPFVIRTKDTSGSEFANHKSVNVESNNVKTIVETNNKATDMKTPNPIQKPPRLTDIIYTTSHYNGEGAVMVTNNTCYTQPSKNPDLIHEAERAKETNETVPNGRLPNGHIPNDDCESEMTASTSSTVCPSSLWFNTDSPNIHDLSAEDSQPETAFAYTTLPRNNASWKMGRAARGLNNFPIDYGLPLPDRVIKVTQDDSAVILQQDSGNSTNSSSYNTLSSDSTPKSGKSNRFWMKGPPLLPPTSHVHNLNRITARDSPDEGYQEGYVGTDV